jgi:hypothetical protein
MGVPAAHETFFGLSRRSFHESDRDAYAAFPTNDVALMAAPFLKQLGKPSIHIVRDPVETVNSFLHMQVPASGHEITDFINYWVQLDGEGDERWADYWEKWNRMCAEAATFTVQIEALSSGEVSDAFLAPIIGASGFVPTWQLLGKTVNRYHQVTSNLVRPHVIDRLRRSGEEFGYRF